MSAPKQISQTQKSETLIKKCSRQARQTAGAILEVLAGNIHSSEAAESLGISREKYYIVESRAMAGMVKACEPRKGGYVHTPERELEALKKAHVKLQQECVRYQTLLRAMQRGVGLSLPKKDRKKAKGTKKGKRQLKPRVRALVIAQKLKLEAPEKVYCGDPSSETKQQQKAGKVGTS
jgi:hypothetical protein